MGDTRIDNDKIADGTAGNTYWQNVFTIAKILDVDYIYLPENRDSWECYICHGLGQIMGYKRLRGPSEIVLKFDREKDETLFWDTKAGGGWSVFKRVIWICPVCNGRGQCHEPNLIDREIDWKKILQEFKFPKKS